MSEVVPEMVSRLVGALGPHLKESSDKQAVARVALETIRKPTRAMSNRIVEALRQEKVPAWGRLSDIAWETGIEAALRHLPGDE